MTQRILVLTGYLLRRFVFSFAGLIFLNLALAFWILMFPPGQGTPDADNYILVIGAFGAVATFLITLSIATHANHAAHYPLVVRLASRVEFLTAVLLAALLAAGFLQALVALLALYRGPVTDWQRLLSIPPLWIAVNILTAVLALHATDFVTNGWSRVYLFGVLAILLFSQDSNGFLSSWFGGLAENIGSFMMRSGAASAGNFFFDIGRWFASGSGGAISRAFGLVFWPFRAITEATVAGVFDRLQALAPALLLLYATFLFLLAADLFAAKDLDFVE